MGRQRCGEVRTRDMLAVELVGLEVTFDWVEKSKCTKDSSASIVICISRDLAHNGLVSYFEFKKQ
jgi:hypothetical protein